MGDLQTTKMRFWIATLVLALVNIALLAYLLRPGSSAAAQEAEEASLQQRINLLKAEVEKWKTSNPQRTREDLKKFYADDVSVRFSQVSEQIEKIIKDTGVTAPSLRYSPEAQDKTSLPSVQPFRVETTVSGDYGKVAKFINAMEQAQLLFIIDKVSLSGQEGGIVTLQITFTTFLKNA